VLAPWPAAGPTLAVLQLLLGPADATCSSRRLLRILDPADELVAGQGCDVIPRIECDGVGDQRVPEVGWKLVHHPTGHSRGAHEATVAAVPGDESLSRGEVTVHNQRIERRSLEDAVAVIALFLPDRGRSDRGADLHLAVELQPGLALGATLRFAPENRDARPWLGILGLDDCE